MAIIRSASGELPHVDLGDALAVSIAIRKTEPHRFERAAQRWSRCVERREATLAEVQAAAWPFENIADEPAALDTLQRLCSRARTFTLSSAALREAGSQRLDVRGGLSFGAAG
jgi:hypothetical protein